VGLEVTDNRFVFVCPMYNAANTLEQMLYSILGQSFKNWKLILIDDVSNEENKLACNKILSNFKQFDDVLWSQHVDVIWNETKMWETKNVLNGLSKCSDNDIICRIDADDYLVELDALAIINSVYNQIGCDALWSAHRWGMSDKNISGPLPHGADPYHHPWVSSHMKTFRKYLLNDVPYENFTNMNGDLVKRAGDQSLYLPVLHNSKSWYYLPRCVYHYTIKDIPETYQTDDAKFQKTEAEFLRARGYINHGQTWEEIIKTSVV
jgi:glycosyltransferase involved in cell wall biosynthesis